MAGKVISKANAAHIQSMHDTTTKLGASCGGAAKRLALKAADLGVYALLDQLRELMLASISAAEAQDYECWPHIEDVFPETLTAIFEVCDQYWQAAYTVDAAGVVSLADRATWSQVREVWVPVDAPAASDPVPAAEGGTSTTMKAGALAAVDASAPILMGIKAIGDRTLELRVAWGRDGHGESFTPATDFDLENFPSPPVLYYHGFKADGKPSSKPVVIGRTVRRENRDDGHYLIAEFNTKAEAQKVLDAAPTGQAVVSPGTAPHLIRKDTSGALTYWPIVEISAWDWDGTPARKQAHPRSLAFPVLKSLYAEAGLSLPALLDPSRQEAAGDAAGDAGESVDATTAGRIIAAVVARAII